jgi:hypothetical protein
MKLFISFNIKLYGFVFWGSRSCRACVERKLTWRFFMSSPCQPRPEIGSRGPFEHGPHQPRSLRPANGAPVNLAPSGCDDRSLTVSPSQPEPSTRATMGTRGHNAKRNDCAMGQPGSHSAAAGISPSAVSVAGPDEVMRVRR